MNVSRAGIISGIEFSNIGASEIRYFSLLRGRKGEIYFQISLKDVGTVNTSPISIDEFLDAIENAGIV